ncbi:MAG TPA: ShlB/FhaC/HecB family hemolysin secretion/activation protein [Candidatus Anammoximicrobium sp.]|nr:ShlB/FhaC/HecB family hemolysin secretion/activation protein [Candidatus Anammoximicrobium sp.]
MRGRRLGNVAFVWTLSLVSGLVGLLGTGMDAEAQMMQQYKEYDRYRYLPRLPQQSERPEPLPDTPREATGDTRELVSELKALIFVDRPERVVPRSGEERGVLVESDYGLWLLQTPAFHEIAQNYLGGPVTQLRLNELVRDTILLYRQNNQPVVDVSIPQQEITRGVVQVVVTESRVGEVRVEGPCYFNPCVLARQLCISPGDPIYESVLIEEQRWLFRNPYRRVDVELMPGDVRGTTDVVFNVQDRRPVRWYAGYEDTGTRFTGLERTFYGVNWMNALWRDDQAGYQYTASSDFDSMTAHSAYYSTALLNRDIITVYGCYAESQAVVPDFPSDNNGVAWQILARWYRELVPCGAYEHGVTAGFDLKSQDSNLEFGGIAVFDTRAYIAQFMLGYNGRATDRLGSWNFALDTYLSPGHLVGHNDNVTYQQIRAYAEANYVYVRGFAERRFWLPQCFEVVGRVTGQVSEANLLSFEQLGFGGYNSIRGYDMYSDVTDSGYFVNLELWSPSYTLGLRDDELRLLAFFDFGNGYNHTLLPGEPDRIDLSSVGAGLRYVARPNAELRVDYGWQLGDEYLLMDRHRVHIGAVLSY